MASGRVHVVGAGVAGLSAATALAGQGREVVVYEAANHAGGRCRSFHDSVLDKVIDNGTHLILSGNGSIAAYLSRIGADDRFDAPARARFPFVDLAHSRRWTLDLGAGRLPFWVFDRRRRVPDTRVRDYLGYRRLLHAAADDTVQALLGGDGALFTNFWRPVALAVLNTPLDTAAARLLAPVLRETVLKGGGACRPMIARRGLSDALIDPALAYLATKGAVVRFGARLKTIERGPAHRVLRFDDGDVELADGDAVILAVPAWIEAELLPGISTPDAHEPIVNVHFDLGDAGMPRDWRGAFCGVLGGTAEWAAARDGVLSVTVSAARVLLDAPGKVIARQLWHDVARLVGWADDRKMPTCRVIKERRATFSQTPAQCRKRPAAGAPGGGIYLAGDWTDTGLPATVEGAVRSGETAARLVALAASDNA